MSGGTWKTLAVLGAAVLLLGCAATAPGGGQQNLAKDSTAADTNTVKDTADADDTMHADSAASRALSAAAQLMVRACENYLAVKPESPKTAEVLGIKASVYYNNHLLEQSRKVYAKIIDEYPNTVDAVNAVRMVAQSFYEENEFEKAQEWYRKLHDVAGEGADKSEAVARIAESIFRMAEGFEKQEHYEDAAAGYERVAMEFPEAKIADVSLFNAGLAYEKHTDWGRAILAYQRLRQRYQSSKIVPKAMFRTAKCYEKLMQWDDAAQMYLRLVANYPNSEMSQAALYNAGFSFENAEKLPEAAATFEKLAAMFPESEDAADVLFRAGELYGRLKDWESVSRVNQEFSRRYGNDADRVVQAQCMLGVALFMQGKRTEAIQQLHTAATTFKRLSDPSTVNRFYAAKAEYTIGEIYHEQQNAVALKQPRNAYRRLLKQRRDLLDDAAAAYARVVKYSISEWTTRAIFQLGKLYEDFAYGVYRQERPKNQSLEETLALELGIAKAVEEYFIEHALGYHEQNVKLGIKESIEDKYVLNSRRKLTLLPTTAGANYLALADIVRDAQTAEKAEGFARIAQKLSLLQKIAPFQERAIELFLKSLELGSRYHEQNEHYTKASTEVTRTAFTVGETYADVARIAREAPIPESFDGYERFVYKTKLLKQIQDYENSAVTGYLKAVKIAEAYAIEDAYVGRTRQRLAELLFLRGRAYDLLCIDAFQNPPFPQGVAEDEKDVYRVRFEEVALRLQEEAFALYRTILEYAEKGFAAGEYVNHAYVRLYQNFPDEFGVVKEEITEKTIGSGPQWKCMTTEQEGWQGLDFADTAWAKARKATPHDSVQTASFPGKPPVPMWYSGGPGDERVYFRRVFYVTEPPHAAHFYLAATDSAVVYLNGERLPAPQGEQDWNKAQQWDLAGRIRQGKNVVGMEIGGGGGDNSGVYPFLRVSVTVEKHLPQFPGTDIPLDPAVVAGNAWSFPPIKNFSPQPVARVQDSESSQEE